MVEVVIKVPEDLKDIIEETSETIYLEALNVVARRRISSLRKRLKELKKKAATYEAKHGKSYEEFSKSVPDTLKSHDDWIEWSYLVKVMEDLSAKIQKLTLITGK